VDFADITRPVTIGVAGGTGSGKTTVAHRLVELIGREQIAYIQHDSYYHGLAKMPRAAGEIINFDHPDSLDTALLITQLGELQAGRAVDIPVYDFVTHSRSTQTTRVEPHPVILIEGILIFAEPELRKMIDVRIFVDTDADIRFIRRLQRDIAERGRSLDSVIAQYLESVRPMHNDFVEPSKRHAHVIIPEGGLNAVAVNMVADFMRDKMRARQGE